MRDFLKKTMPTNIYIQRIIFISIACVLLLIVGLSINQYMGADKDNDAMALLAKIQETANTPLKRMEELQNVKNTIPNFMKVAVALNIANIALENDKSDIAKMNYKIVGESSKNLYVIGMLGEASALLQMNKPLEAITLLKALEKKIASDNSAIVLLTLAEAQEQANLTKNALETYNKVAKLDTNLLGFVEYKIAQLSSK